MSPPLIALELPALLHSLFLCLHFLELYRHGIIQHVTLSHLSLSILIRRLQIIFDPSLSFIVTSLPTAAGKKSKRKIKTPNLGVLGGSLFSFVSFAFAF